MAQLQVIQILIFVLLGFALPAIGMIGLAYLLQIMFGYHRPNSVKNQPYECGIKAFQDAFLQFDIRYYLYALLFIIFDIEVIFIMPWAVTSDFISKALKYPMLGAIEMAVFLVILTFGLVYAWKKGALEWE